MAVACRHTARLFPVYQPEKWQSLIEINKFGLAQQAGKPTFCFLSN